MNKRHSLALLAVAATLMVACQQKTANNGAETAQTAAEMTEETTHEEDEKPQIPDFTLPDMNGQEQSIMKEVEKNKLTIIDFWASWCGPCRAEMPSVVGLYEEYKDRGLGIVGISLDENGGDWKTAVETMNMKWTQLSDLQGWNNKAARMFDVNGIPFTMIVDTEGRLLAAGLRGGDLRHFVEQYLK